MKKKQSKFNHYMIRKRLQMSFRFTTGIAVAAIVISVIIMFGLTKKYSGALDEYGFVQGDIGKAMVTFSEARSAAVQLLVIQMMTRYQSLCRLRRIKRKPLSSIGQQ